MIFCVVIVGSWLEMIDLVYFLVFVLCGMVCVFMNVGIMFIGWFELVVLMIESICSLVLVLRL